MTVFSRALVKVSRWELPTSHNNRRAFSSPSLSSGTNHELACDSGQDRSASHSLKDVAAPYGLFDQETEQSDSFATQLSEGKLGATRALNEQSGSNCESSNVPAPRGTSPAMPSSSTLGATVSTDTQQIETICKSTNVPAPSGPTNVLAPASSSPGATLSCLNVGNHNEQLGSYCKSTNVPAPSGPTNVLAPASSSPGATLSCLNVGNHNEQLGSYCKSTNVPAPSGPTNVLAPASSSPGATLSCLNVGNHNEQLGSLCKSTYVPAPSGPAFTLSASSTSSGGTLSCLNVGTHNERIGSFRESDDLARRVQRAPSPIKRAAENGNPNPISSQSSQTKTARATNNTLILSGKSASPTKNLDSKGATNYTNMSGKSASSAVKSIMGGTAASSTAKSVLTVIGGTAASSTPSHSQSHDSNSTVTGGITTAFSTRSNDSSSTVTVTGGMKTASSTQSHDSNSSVTVTGGMMTASSTRSNDSSSSVTATGGMTTASSTQSHDSNSTVTLSGDMTTARSIQSPVSTVVSGLTLPTSSGPDSGAPDNESKCNDSNCIDTQSRTNVKSSNCICKCHCDTNSDTSEANLKLNMSVKLNRRGTSACSKTIRFFTHVMVYYLMLLIHSFKFGSSSPSSTLLKSKMYMSMCTTGLYEANTTMEGSPPDSAINMTMNSTRVSMSFITHVVVYYLMFFVYTFVKKAKESCVMFVRYLLDLNKTESTPSNTDRSSKVLPPCTFCDRDITNSEILNQLEPPVYCTVSSQYIACDCKNSTATVEVELEPCDNFIKPCPNAWFDFRSHVKNKSLLEYFDERAIREMLFDTEVTVATAMELFDIPLPVSGSVLDVELLLQHLQDEYHFTLKCADCGEVLSAPIISGGRTGKYNPIMIKGKTKKKRPSIGRKPKAKRKGANTAKGDTESTTSTIGSAGDPFHEPPLRDEKGINEKIKDAPTPKGPSISRKTVQSEEDLYDPRISGGGRGRGRGGRKKGPLLGRIRKKSKHVPEVAQVAESESEASDFEREDIFHDIDKNELDAPNLADYKYTNNLKNGASSIDDGIFNPNRVTGDAKCTRHEIDTELEKSCHEIFIDSENEPDPINVKLTKSQSKGAKYQAKYGNSLKGKASLKRYRSKPKGKAAQKKAYATYLAKVKGKAAKHEAHATYLTKVKGKAAQKKAYATYLAKVKGKAAKHEAHATYLTKDKGKAAKHEAHATYLTKDKGKAAQKKAYTTYLTKVKGKAAKHKAQLVYVKKEAGKATKMKAQSVYAEKDKGKIALKKAYRTYSSTDGGKAARELADKTYSLSVHRRISRKRRDSIKKKYMKRYMRYYRECDKIQIDFSAEDIPGNTRGLREHVVGKEFLENYKNFEAEILKCRTLMSEPQRYRTSNKMRTAGAWYKLTLRNRISSAMNNLSDESLVTIPGLTDKALRRKHINPKHKASSLLAHLTWLKRQQCAAALKMLHHRLSSFSDAVISKMDAQENDSDQKSALLGLQCHQKMSEPYHTKVSFTDGIPYNYEAVFQKFEEDKKSEKKVPSHLVYRCNDQCVIPDKREDLVKLRNLFENCSQLSESNTNEFRKFLQKFQWCTKWHEFADSEKNDINPLRLYLFPVKHRNHPETCYIPPQGNANASLEHTKCKSQEVTLREFMVHYTNPRKFYSLISKAIVADKLMCDIDAATIMGDVEYLSKLVKINLQYEEGSTVGFETVSEAREWTHESIEQKMADVAIKGKTSRTTFSYKDLFDRDRFDLPSVRCYCCDRLVTPKQSTSINLRTAKKLQYNPKKGIEPHQVYKDLQTFLINKGNIQPPNHDESDESNICESFESHPTKWLHGLTFCNSCRLVLNKGEIPANSLLNNMYTGETPEVLKVLNPIELMFVSRTKCFQTIVKPGPISSKLPQSERLNALKGNLIHLPLSTASTTKRLFESTDKSATDQLFDVEDLVQLYGQPNKDRKIWNHVVDRKKVHAALTWLHENNLNYKDIIVPATSEDILPNVFGYICNLCQQDFDTEEELSEHKNSSPNCYENISGSRSGSTHDETFVSHQIFANDDNDCLKNLSENETDPDSDVPCPGGKAADMSATSESSSSTTNESTKSDQNTSDKPWIEQVPKNSLNNAFQHFSVVGNESNPERDTFQMLRIGSDPVPYYEPNLDCMAFPDRYPYGSGGLSAQREKNLTEAIFEQTRIMTWNNHQRRNLPYLFHLLAQKEKRLIKSAIFSVLNKDYKSLSKGDIEKGTIEQNPELLKRINSVLKNLPTQKEFWHDVKTKVEAMVFEFGAPTFWATFSPGEYDDDDMLKYLRERNSDLPGVENMTVSQLVCKDPVLACAYLQTKFDALLEHILSKANPIGKIKHHFVRTEYQTRLMPHFHCIFWVEDAPLIGQDSDKDVLDFIGKHISCKMPNPNKDSIMYGLVKKFQLHKCNSYCLRRPKQCRGKARCKFGFPRAACLKPVLHGVASSIASHKTGSYKKRLYELQRNHNEKCVNDYNPILLYLWQGNVDIQFIGEKSESLVDYISKYATKAPRSEITDFDLNAMKNENKSTWAQLFQAASRLMKNREVGAMEARNFMLSENPIQTNASFLFINSVYASKRKSMLKSKKDLKSLPDDSTDIYYGDLIGTWYPKRPPYDGPVSLKDMSLYDFASTYERIGNAAAAKIKDKSVLLRLDSNAGYMKKRSQDPKKSLVIYGPSYLDPFKDSEAYYFSFLLLHKPFWQESLLMGSSDSYQREFEKLKNDLPVMAAHEEKVRRKKNFRESMEKSAEAAAKKMSLDNIELEEQQDVDNGSDLFETIRKQSTIENEEQLNEAVAGLSSDQLAVYNLFVDNVNHYYQHKTKNCVCREFEPIRLFVSGFGGSGKSHLIRTLMAYQYIRSEVKKDPCHFLLGAPTGIASHNIGGMTLHSMWNLPVDHSNGRKNSAKEYRRLKSNQINIMRANYAHACGLIVDEVSMISNQMLMAINMRMNEVMGSKDPAPFGGMPIVVFGDLFQLEPVSGSQPFVPLTSNVAKKMFGGFPCAPNIWEGFKFRQLNTNHRQKGDDNIKWRTTLDHIRFGTLSSSDVDYLNERIIDTSGCKLKGEYLDRYVTKFLECEAAGLGPVCLLPENKMVEEFNAAVMQKKGEVPFKVCASDKLQCPKDKEIFVRKLLSTLESNETGGLESYLNLAVNTRIMLRVNDKRTPGLVNGARGTVNEIVMDSSGKEATKIMVQFDGIDKVQAIERIERKFQVHPGCYIYRKMFPLINSYAMTIHKSQSLSLPCVFADLGDKIFADGMTYVAVSRCLRHKGLYLMNFNPAKVVASEKACREYSRLLGKGHIHRNQGCKTGKLERCWYTTSVIRKATKVTAEKIKQTAGSIGTESEAASNAKNGNHSSTKISASKKTSLLGKRKYPVGNDSSRKKSKVTKSTHPSSSNIPGSGKTKSKNSIPKIKMNPTPSAEKVESPPSDVVVTHESLGMNRPFFDYIPVDETWQRSICNAFGWRFLTRSRGANVCDLRGVISHTKPKPSKTQPDGNCWYRAVASIVIGNERFWRRIKDAVLEFMTVNISVLQNMYNSDVNLLARDNVIDAPIDSYFAERLIEYYRGENIWVENVVMEFTAIMLNTRWYLYTPKVDPKSTFRPCWSTVEDTYFWSVRQAFTSYPARVDNTLIPDLTDQSMYINWKNRNHFEPCQNGLHT